ncbi:glyoxalase [Ahniella affigens]|uniref:Glyoxalase n=1 Tax=Ahniella affigens TaxID=2021234 RepID=A0A2P1PZ18_9GAMM|nr:VOC family protein [Ahniella affigens]AVQ00076.1 glyoxalase [Ahniella affigens]
MAKVVGLGGLFFKAGAPGALSDWYHKHLGMPTEAWGGAMFLLRDHARPTQLTYSVWSPFPADTQYFQPSDKPFMVNLRVDDLDGLLAQLREQGVSVLDRREDSENGKFGYVVDPEGVLLELWEPNPDDPGLPKPDAA